MEGIYSDWPAARLSPAKEKCHDDIRVRPDR